LTGEGSTDNILVNKRTIHPYIGRCEDATAVSRSAAITLTSMGKDPRPAWRPTVGRSPGGNRIFKVWRRGRMMPTGIGGWFRPCRLAAKAMVGWAGGSTGTGPSGHAEPRRWSEDDGDVGLCPV